MTTKLKTLIACAMMSAATFQSLPAMAMAKATDSMDIMYIMEEAKIVSQGNHGIFEAEDTVEPPNRVMSHPRNEELQNAGLSKLFRGRHKR